MFTELSENDSDPISSILNESDCRVEVFREEVNSILHENIVEDAIIFSTENDINNQSIGSLKVGLNYNLKFWNFTLILIVGPFTSSVSIKLGIFSQGTSWHKRTKV